MDEISKTLENAARFAAKTGMSKFTRFLDPAQAVQAQRLAREQGAAFSAFGGYERSERVIGCFHARDEVVSPEEYPIVCLHARYAQRFVTLSHRDLLGAFMSLGLTRDCIGDMIISDADVYLFATEGTADFIAASMTSAGKASLRFEILGAVPPMPEPKGRTFSAIVSSLRLDAVLAAAYQLSRAEAAEAIRAGLVKLDHVPCEKVDMPVREGALLSLRGKGRVSLASLGATTKKQRLCVTFFKPE
ncbi:MAG: YlmH/Sll1252 family protein [Clostridia bacterium]|nr:YlmH/Sll1252 family protein [Clostridia bacterium]